MDRRDLFQYTRNLFLLILLVQPLTAQNEVSRNEVCQMPHDFQGSCNEQVHEGYVQVGTQCLDQTAVPIICDWGGVWREAPTGTAQLNHHIQKRAVLATVAAVVGIGTAIVDIVKGIAEVVCLFVCKTDEGPPPNKPPTMTCPSVAYLHTAKDGETTVNVSWSDPVVTDEEDGNSLKLNRVGPKPGSEFEEGSHYIQYKATDTGGLNVYCTITFTVKVNRCQQMQWPQHGRITCDKRAISGSTCTVSCNDGYEPEGASQSVCNKDTWTTSLYCLPKVCDTIPVVANGQVFCSGSKVTYKTSCTITCDKGYTVEGPPMIMCDANAEFTKTGQCIDSQAPEFPSGCPVDIEDYAEKKGGPKTISLEEPTVTDNSNVSPTLTMTPGSGHAFTVGRTVVTVVAADAAGNEAQCTFVVNIKTLVCDEPDFDKSGKNLLTFNCPNGMLYGDYCTMSCKSGYPLEGSGTVLCDMRPGNYVPPQVHWTVPPDSLEPYCKINPCPDLPAPINGALACDQWSHGRMCQMQCNIEFDVPRAVPYEYVCGESNGEWRPNDNIRDCTERREPDSMKMPSELYYFTGSCPDEDTQQQIKENFIKMLKNNTLFKEICGENVPECRPDFVSVKCGPTSTRRKRSTSMEVRIDFDIVLLYHENGRDREQVIEEYEQRFNDISNAIDQAVKSRSLDIGVPGLELRDDSFGPGQPDFVCGPGTVSVYETASCAGCPTGTYYNGSVDDCVDCPVGAYQDGDFSNSCKLCPNGFSTLSIAARTSDGCIAMCEAGTWSSTGLIPCSPCHDGSYQSSRGMTSCVKCPMWQTTKLQASSQSTDCIDFDINSEGDIIIGQTETDLYSLSMVFWIHLGENTTSTLIGLEDPSLGNNVSILLTDRFTVNAGSQSFPSQESVRTRQWLHIAVIVDHPSSNVKLYVDGNNVLSQTLSGTMVTSETQLHLKTVSGVTVNGVNVVDRPVSEPEIKLMASTCEVKTITESVINMRDQLSGIQTPSKCDAINECESSPCGEHTCINEIGGYKCQCLKGYSGQHCEVPPDHCLHHSCEHGAQCVNSYNNYSCVCTEGYRGALCEEEIVHGGWGDWTDWSECSVTCGGGMTTRTRQCNSPPPDPDGKPCLGSDKETDQCQTQECPYCISLPRSYGVVRRCNESEDMITCTISCIEDLVFVQEILPLYFCGRETNYTWNHQTIDNPTARLPACSRRKTPEGYTLTREMEYSTLPCSLNKDQHTSIKEQISTNTVNLKLPCVEDGSCQSSIEFHTCDSSSRRKRATTASAAVILATPQETSLLLNISTAVKNNETLPREIEDFIIKMAHFELSAQEVVYNSTYVFTVSVDGTLYFADVGSARTSMDVACPPGTTPVTGLCGECPPGSKEMNSLCVLCGRGTYQEWPGMVYCDQCPAGKSTPGLGSTSVNDCTVGGSETTTSSPFHVPDIGDKTLIIVLASTICSVLVVMGVVGAAIFWKLTRSKRKTTPVPESVCPDQKQMPAGMPPPYTLQESWQKPASSSAMPMSTLPPVRVPPSLIAESEKMDMA